MPTPTGLPKAGDRIRYTPPALEAVPSYDGTVVARGAGAMWSLTVAWDNGVTNTAVDAAGYWAMGAYELLEAVR